MDISKYVKCSSYPALDEAHTGLLKAQGMASLSMPDWYRKFSVAMDVCDIELAKTDDKPIAVAVAAAYEPGYPYSGPFLAADDDEPDEPEIPAEEPAQDVVEPVNLALVEDEPDAIEMPTIEPETAEPEPELPESVTEPEPDEAAPEPEIPNIRNIRRVAEYREPVPSQQEIDEIEEKIAEVLPQKEPVDDDVDNRDDSEDGEYLDEAAGDDPDDTSDDDSES